MRAFENAQKKLHAKLLARRADQLNPNKRFLGEDNIFIT